MSEEKNKKHVINYAQKIVKKQPSRKISETLITGVKPAEQKSKEEK